MLDRGRLRAARTIRRSSAGDAEATPANMTLDEAYELLGVKESASFDDILVAKNQQIRKLGGDRDKVVRVCAPGWPACLQAAPMAELYGFGQWTAGISLDESALHACRWRQLTTCCSCRA